MDEKEFKDRTKKFALRVIKWWNRCQMIAPLMCLVNSCSDRLRLSPRIIVLLVAPSQKPI